MYALRAYAVQVCELPEGSPRFPALQNLSSQGLGWALFGVVQYLLWVLARTVPYLELPFCTCSLVHLYSSFKSQLQRHLLFEAFTKWREMLTHVFLSTLYRFLYYFAHQAILQFIHLFLSTRVPSLLERRTISLILFLVSDILSGQQ